MRQQNWWQTITRPADNSHKVHRDNCKSSPAVKLHAESGVRAEGDEIQMSVKIKKKRWVHKPGQRALYGLCPSAQSGGHNSCLSVQGVQLI